MFVLSVYIVLFFNFLKLSELCPLEYYATDPNHSYCSHPFPNAIDQSITSSQRKSILEMHNYERRLVRGTNMEKMYWNDELAEIALRYARTCIFEHDKSSQRSVPKIPLSTGQNLAMGYENWTQAIEGWIEEKEHYFHGYPSTGIVSHYTQMIWHSTVLVGCAATICPPYGPYNIPWPFYVCNYITGQLNSNIYPPYNQGGGDHPLHDCHGKVCLYNGTLNLNTCECQCSTYASGSHCEQLNCSKLPPCPYYSSTSCVAVNVPLECPRLCGLCDRYDVLKHVYGENNLIPNKLIVRPMTTRLSSSTKNKFKIRKTTKPILQNRIRIVSTKVYEPTTTTTTTTTTTAIMLLTSSTNHSFRLSLSMFLYLLHNNIIIICRYL